MDIEDHELYAECEDDNENTDVDGFYVDEKGDKPKSNYQLMKERKMQSNTEDSLLRYYLSKFIAHSERLSKRIYISSQMKSY